MDPLIRAAGAADAARVAALLIDARAAFMPYAPSVHTDDEVRAWVAAALVPGGGVTVAEFDGRVVGMLATEREADAAWITQLAVDPALVGRGLGACLLAEAMRTLARPIRLWTFQANIGAQRFYERHGFRAILRTDGGDNEERCPDVLLELAGMAAGPPCTL